MLEGTLQALLREYAQTQGAIAVAIGHADDDDDDGSHQLSMPLGSGRCVWARFRGPAADSAVVTREMSLAQLAQRLRAVGRAHRVSALPFVVFPAGDVETAGAPGQRVLQRIEQFLAAVATSSGLSSLFLVLRGNTLAAVGQRTKLQEARLALLVRQVDAAADDDPQSSHGELVQSDVYARSFWYGACLVGFADAPYSVDFVRHRCRRACVELSHLLTLLEDDPPDPAQLAPIPET